MKKMGKPKVRFKGYTDDWEQRKFADFTWDAGKRNREDLDLEPYAITNEHGFIRQCDAHDDFGYMKDTDRKAYNIVQPNSFAYNPARINVGSIGYYKGVENVIVSSLYEVFQTDNYVNDRFLWHWFKSDEFPRWIERLQEGSVRLYFYYDKLCECQLHMPSLEEQEKIASFLDALDHLITLHQRKCENAQKLKKYMLQKMFPKNGTNVPEIRFEGFKDAWEQRKFGEIVEKYEDPVETPTEGYTRLGIRSHAKGTFHSYVEKGKELETAKMFRVAADKFIVNITFGWEHAVAITNENDAGKLVSHRFPQYSFNAGMDPKFFRYLILDENFKHHLELSSPGGAGRNRVLKLNDMLQYKMNFPSEVEQKKIAAYFDDLDHLITLHQHKCEELKNIKKFMLQNMFVQEK